MRRSLPFLVIVTALVAIPMAQGQAARATPTTQGAAISGEAPATQAATAQPTASQAVASQAVASGAGAPEGLAPGGAAPIRSHSAARSGSHPAARHQPRRSGPASAAPTAASGGVLSGGVLALGATDITGNKELPKVMVIVPWKRSDGASGVMPPTDSLLDEALEPVDRDVFQRRVRYYGQLHAAGAHAGGGSASGNREP